MESSYLEPPRDSKNVRDKLFEIRGGHWGVLNTAIPQKNMSNTAILQYRVKTRCHTETATLYIKFRANNTETEIKIWK